MYSPKATARVGTTKKAMPEPQVLLPLAFQCMAAMINGKSYKLLKEPLTQTQRSGCQGARDRKLIDKGWG